MRKYFFDVTTREASFAVYLGIVAVFKVFNMYCSVYGCTSDSQRNPEGKIHFFGFPAKATNKQEKKRRDRFLEAKIYCSHQFHVRMLLAFQFRRLSPFAFAHIFTIHKLFGEKKIDSEIRCCTNRK